MIDRKANWKAIWVIVAVSVVNIGLHVASKKGYIDGDSIEIVKDQVFFLILGQSGKAIRPARREDDPSPTKLGITQ